LDPDRGRLHRGGRLDLHRRQRLLNRGDLDLDLGGSLPLTLGGEDQLAGGGRLNLTLDLHGLTLGLDLNLDLHGPPPPWTWN